MSVTLDRHRAIDVVVKIGGALLSQPAQLDVVLAEVAAAPAVLVVPGGGPFADTVRDLDRSIVLGDDAAHWMAILGMDQYAHLLVGRTNGVLVTRPEDVEAALLAIRVPVLAPYAWLRQHDPLPHSWDVTSDTIAAWFAGQLGASRLVLVKAAHASGPAMVDPCFERFLPSHVAAHVVTADRVEALQSALHGRP